MKGKSFNRFTITGNIRLAPQYIWNQGENDKNHKNISWLNNKTLREKIMSFEKGREAGEIIHGGGKTLERSKV